MNLNTGKKTTRIGRIKVSPMTDQVINRVEALAHKQGIKELKMQNGDKTVFCPTDWLAGVDYDPEENDSDDDDDNYKFNDEEPAANDDDFDDPNQFEDIEEAELQGLEEDMQEDPNQPGEDDEESLPGLVTPGEGDDGYESSDDEDEEYEPPKQKDGSPARRTPESPSNEIFTQIIGKAMLSSTREEANGMQQRPR